MPLCKGCDAACRCSAEGVGTSYRYKGRRSSKGGVWSTLLIARTFNGKMQRVNKVIWGVFERMTGAELVKQLDLREKSPGRRRLHLFLHPGASVSREARAHT